MKIGHYTDTAASEADTAGAEGVTIRWVISKEDGAPNFARRIFEVRPGGHTPHHEHDWEHEIFIIDGSGCVVQNGRETGFRRGDVIFVAPGEPHQMKNPSDQVLTFMCLVPHAG